MSREYLARLHHLTGPSIVALGYYVLAALSLYMTRGADGIATIWPSSGLLLAVMVVVPKPSRIKYIVAAGAASMMANVGAGATFGIALSFTFANITEALVGSWMLRSLQSEKISFIKAKTVVQFCFAALAASLWSAAIATLLSQSGWDFFLSWLTTVALGMLLIAPIIIIGSRLVVSGFITELKTGLRIETFLTLMSVALITTGVFAQSDYPLLFVPMVSLLWATFRLGPFGAAAGVLIIAVIATLFTGNHSGPIEFVGGSQRNAVLFLQFYLLILLGSALPFAALLSARSKLTRNLDESNRYLEKAEAIANVGHWHLDLIKNKLIWSQEIFRIYGRIVQPHPKLEDGIAAYHEDDIARVKAILEAAIENGKSFEFEARIVQPSGEVRHVISRGETRANAKGKVISVFGMLQDITSQVENQETLNKARKAAEMAAQMAMDAAATAKIIANTDELTGLPNRRRTLEVLQDVMDTAGTSNGKLSIAMLDIDNFKSFNDKYGHAVGDEVIRLVAHTASAILRESDFIGRYGGEEFVIILSGASAKTAMAVSERIRHSIEKARAQSIPAVSVTASIGVATYSPHVRLQELLRNADEALYEAKDSGRNALRLAAA